MSRPTGWPDDALGGGPLTGLWEPQADPATGGASARCTMFTWAPNAAWERIRHRMPVVLQPAVVTARPDPELPLGKTHALCTPCPEEVLRVGPAPATASAA